MCISSFVTDDEKKQFETQKIHGATIRILCAQDQHLDVSWPFLDNFLSKIIDDLKEKIEIFWKHVFEIAFYSKNFIIWNFDFSYR